MHQHHVVLPPPPPTPRLGGSNNGPADIYSPRRRPTPSQPPSLTTSFLRVQGPPISPTPISEGNSTPFPFSPCTPVALNPRGPGAAPPVPAVALPPTAPMEPYNPRQWTPAGQQVVPQSAFAAPSSAASSTREVTGMEEVMPSPPPPYSPESLSTTSFASVMSPSLANGAFTASPVPLTGSILHSPQPMSPSFPPPPGGASSRHRDRSTSGIGGTRAFLANLNLRGKQPVYQTDQQASSPMQVSQPMDIRAPASRRAASTGHIQSFSARADPVGFAASHRASPDNSWQPGMPLPGPPPGLPPTGARSQSLNRCPTGSSTSSVRADNEFTATRPTQARHVAETSILSPIPHTPANWEESQNGTSEATPDAPPADSSPAADSPYQPLRIETGSAPASNISRRPAKRDSRGEGLRERRSRSRRAKERSGGERSPSSDGSKRSGQISNPSDGTISRRREHGRPSSYGEPASAPSTDLGDQAPLESPSKTADVSAASARASKSSISLITPPYTPGAGKLDTGHGKKRPESGSLRIRSENTAAPAPITPARPQSAGSAKASARLDSFALQALERHRAFIEKEVAASSDEERLELFTNFIIHESRLRRDRYHAAYTLMASDIVDMMGDMWRSYTRTGKRAVTPTTSTSSYDPTIPSWASDGQPNSALGVPSSASSFGDNTPATDLASFGDIAESKIDRAEARQWPEAFKPTLSPIESMAQSTLHDEDSSRGRAPSRWWEQSHSNSGSGSIGKPERLERSHRETKYMGIRASELAEAAELSPVTARDVDTPGIGPADGVNEYPPEKVGWHVTTDLETPQPTPKQARERKPSNTSTQGAALDVSRLITLPPPYPRHYPAVNNKHPLLADLRNDHRTLIDQSTIRRIKDAFLDQDFAIRKQQKESAKERRTGLRATINDKLASGAMSFAEAAKAEADFDKGEAERSKAEARANFDRFETQVAQPTNELLLARIAEADGCIQRLTQDVENDLPDPNQAQEEGDEKPERLEKLTLLKWLFEAREILHKEMFELHAERSEQYSEVILTPYRIQRAQAKIDEATAFFGKDSKERQLNFAREAAKRHEELQAVVEKHVSRGVEDQLSAFWDIAPSLLKVIGDVPENLASFEVLIPPAEYEETASYREHPLQYLYCLLNHAEKSTYQFIESQINLLCLLHEVRTVSTKCRIRLVELETGKGPTAPSPSPDVMALRAAEDRLTEDLKEKVGEVERQWKEALGDGLEGCKSRVKAYLQSSGGWEDGLDS